MSKELADVYGETPFSQSSMAAPTRSFLRILMVAFCWSTENLKISSASPAIRSLVKLTVTYLNCAKRAHFGRTILGSCPDRAR